MVVSKTLKSRNLKIVQDGGKYITIAQRFSLVPNTFSRLKSHFKITEVWRNPRRNMSSRILLS